MATLKAFALFLTLTSFSATLMFRVLPDEVPLYTFTYLLGNPRLQLIDFLATSFSVYLISQACRFWIARRNQTKSSLVLLSPYPLLLSVISGFTAALVHFNFRGYAVSFFWPWALFTLPTTLALFLSDGWMNVQKNESRD